MQRFTVSKPGGLKHLEFIHYFHLMKKWEIDEFNMPRTPDPETGQRWLPVWDNREEAERFAKELRKATKNRSWKVYEVDRKRVSQGPMGPLEIFYGCQHSGYTYALDGYAKDVIKNRFPEACQVKSVFIHTDTSRDFEASQGPIWDEIALILTGLTKAELDQLGGYHLRDPLTDEIWHALPLIPNGSIHPANHSMPVEVSKKS